MTLELDGQKVVAIGEKQEFDRTVAEAGKTRRRDLDARVER
jgi:hypothetical protein